MDRSRWLPRLALLGVLGVAAVLRLLWLDREGWSNQYYAATVQSMLTGWKAFFFACYDPECFVSVDKPPLGFWVQAAFAKVLGTSGASLILPQALAGIASVGVLYAMVRRTFGVIAGLIAALVLAVMPVSVATDRNNTIDGQLVLVTLLAALCALRSVETGRARWLFASFALVGLGFEIKMLQAYLVVPALALVYLVAARAGLLRRVAHLAGAGALMLAISLAWPLAVDLTPPEDRPYVGGSQDNSVLELITGHNGLARIGAFGRGLLGRTGQAGAGADGPSFAPAPQRAPGPGAVPLPANVIAIGGGGGESGAPGPLRLLNEQLAGQLGWLLTLAVLGGGLAVVRARWRPARDHHAAFLIVFGAWFLTMAAFFSVTSGIFHRYYLVMLAPAVSALVGAGTVELWREYRERRRPLAAALALTLALTAGLQSVILAPYPEWETWLVPALVGAAAAALVVAVAALRWRRSTRGLALAGVTAALLLLLAAPTAWAALPVANAPGDMLPAGGPDRGPGPRGARAPFAIPGGPGGPSAPAAAPGPGPGRADPRLVQHLLAHRGGARWIVAVASAGTASPLMLATKAPIMALGGFGGGDRILDADGFAALVARGEIRFVLADGGGPDGAIAFGPGGPPGRTPGPAPGAGPAPGPLARPADDGVMGWVRANCAEVAGLPGLRDCARR